MFATFTTHLNIWELSMRGLRCVNILDKLKKTAAVCCAWLCKKKGSLEGLYFVPIQSMHGRNLLKTSIRCLVWTSIINLRCADNTVLFMGVPKQLHYLIKKKISCRVSILVFASCQTRVIQPWKCPRLVISDCMYTNILKLIFFISVLMNRLIKSCIWTLIRDGTKTGHK
jgi:hypothetical protein